MFISMHRDSYTHICDDFHPLTFLASTPDIPTWNEAMNGPLADGFWKACSVEVETLERKDC